MTPLGRTSVTVAPSAAFWPLFTPIVYVTSLRTCTADVDALMLSCGSPQTGSVNEPMRVPQLKLPLPR